MEAPATAGAEVYGPAAPAMCPPPAEADTPVLLDPSEATPADARRAYAEAQRLADEGRVARALLHLNVVDSAFPSVTDRTALMRGRLLLQTDEPERACEAFEQAAESPDSTTRAHAAVGRVRCLILSGDRSATRELRSLLRQFPALPEELSLRYELARAREAAGQRVHAAILYRRLDHSHPGSSAAVRARARLEALEADGVRVPGLSTEKRVERAETLVRSGPMDLAKRAVAELEDERLPRNLRSRIAIVKARIARVEGRWQDAHEALALARWSPSLPEDVTRQSLNAQASDLADALKGRETERARERIRQLKGWRPWLKLPTARLLLVVRIAAPAELTEPLDAALDALERKDVAARYRMEAALMSIGAAPDERILSLLGELRSHPRYGTQARYHYARALERLGRWKEAERQHLAVMEQDDELGFYRMWSEQRLWTVRQALLAPPPDGKPIETVAKSKTTEAAPKEPEGEPLVYASLAALERSRPSEQLADDASRAKGEPLDAPRTDVDPLALAAELEPLAEQWGEAYPSLPRARDLLLLGATDAATDELHEAYLAWRQAIGRPLRRAGLEAVYRGESRARERVTWKERAQRRRLDRESRDALSAIAEQLGEMGVALGFAGWERASERPRAYEDIVYRAAAKHGVDPNLLFAVMRVESVYQKRILSYAGAVGLMQIMPRTGRLIAHQLGREDYTTADLLDPATNIEFAAWYFSSLIERFDGRLPLAIASYNGGPHNVRRWLRDHPSDMPVDAFVEHIPFGQTHRYVRRVLTHYAAYREQQGLPMRRLALRLPEPDPDPVGF